MSDFIDYNEILISVPASVTLSSCIDILKISGHYVDGLIINRNFNDSIYIMNYDSVILSIHGGKIFNITWFPLFEIFKPLYLYWIAGTDIIDDLLY